MLPERLSGVRLVARTCRPGAAVSSSVTTGAASRRCSKLSSTRRSSRGQSQSASIVSSFRPSASAITDRTSPSSLTGASDTSTGSGWSAATASARRVFPTPPGPTRVSSRSPGRRRSARDLGQLLHPADERGQWGRQSRARLSRRRLRRACLSRRDGEQGLVLDEDPPLQLLELRARLEPELIDERGARVLVCGERIRLPAVAIEREDQQLTQPLTQRVLAHERLELGHHLRMTAEREICLDAKTCRDQPELFEAGDLVPCPPLVLEVREGRSPPERERITERGRGLARRARGQQAATTLEQALEPLQIQRCRLHPRQVAGRPRLDHALAKRLAQLRNVDLHGLDRARRRPLAPQLVDQSRRRYDLVRAQQQQRQQRPLLRGGQRNLVPVAPGRDRSEQPELHAANVTLSTSARQTAPHREEGRRPLIDGCSGGGRRRH